MSDAGAANGQKKKMAIIVVSSLILVAMVVGLAVGIPMSRRKTSTEANPSVNGAGELSTSVKAVKAICHPTEFKEVCEEKLTAAAGNTTDPKELIRIGFEVARKELEEAIKNSTTIKELAKDPRAAEALRNCEQLLELAVDELKKSFEKLGGVDLGKIDEFLLDFKVWLSSTITYQQTCLDGFENTTGNAGENMKKFLRVSQELTSNALGMVGEFSSMLSGLQIPGMKRRLLAAESGRREEEFPSWVGEGQRALLQATPALVRASGATVKPNVVVALDGSGKYKSINEALKEVPKKNAQTFIIYVKAGTYKERVVVEKTMTHVFMIGDGPTKTRITGSLNHRDGVRTWDTASAAVMGDNFWAKDIGFENTAGGLGHQAVALLVQSDWSIFYNCHMDAYQDTLYVHTKRQFFRDCTITGTVDFIFGNACALFQNCLIMGRKPLDNQQNLFTAQGRIKPYEPGAIVLQNCTITGDSTYLPVKNQFKSYLGRPWKEYSRTIVMESFIGDVIHPEGWQAWSGDQGLNTLFYSEVNNRGPGSNTSKRVTWKGIKKLTKQQASDFTAAKFVEGDRWIKATGVPYVSGFVNVKANSA